MPPMWPWALQKPHRLAPSEHQNNPTTKIGEKRGGEFTYPKMVPLVLTQPCFFLESPCENAHCTVYGLNIASREQGNPPKIQPWFVVWLPAIVKPPQTSTFSSTGETGKPHFQNIPQKCFLFGVGKPLARSKGNQMEIPSNASRCQGAGPVASVNSSSCKENHCVLGISTMSFHRCSGVRPAKLASCK